MIFLFYEKETLEGYECNIIILYLLDVCSSPIPFFTFLSPFFFIYWVPMSQHDVILIFSHLIRIVWSLSVVWGEKLTYRLSVQDWTGTTSTKREEQEFTYQVKNVYGGDATLRQVAEAIEIRREKSGMNGKGEWNHTSLPRLVVD